MAAADVTHPRPVEVGLDLAFAASGRVNTHGRPWQDRWAVGQNQRGGWLVLADGISGGDHGDRAADAAVEITVGHLSGSPLDEAAVMMAIGLAHAAVRPWYRRSQGGTTLSVVTFTPARVVAATVGDSPVLAVRDGVPEQLSPAAAGPLRSWVGSQEPLAPWLDSWPLKSGHAVLVCSDGVAAGRARFDEKRPDPQTWADTLLDRYRTPNGDDATVLAALRRGRPGGQQGEAGR